MTDVMFDTTEVARLAVDLAHAGPYAIEEARHIIEDGAVLIENTARQYVPVKTGATRDSIGTDMESELSAAIGPTTPYAPELEYGTGKMAPRPFMGRSLDQHTPQIVAAFDTIGIPGVAGGATSIVLGATLSSSVFSGAKGGAPGLSSGTFQ